MILKRLIERADVEDAFQQLDSLTKEESLMAVTENMGAAYRVNRNAQVIEGVIHRVDQNTNTVFGEQSQEEEEYVPRIICYYQ